MLSTGVMPLPAAKLLGMIQRRVEVAHRGHHVQRVARLEPLHEFPRGPAIGHLLHRDPDHAFLQWAAADTIAAAQLLATDFEFQREILPMDELEVFLQFGWDPQGDHDRIGGFLPDFLDLQGMEPCHADRTHSKDLTFVTLTCSNDRTRLR
jgi:hypothetical protein